MSDQPEELSKTEARAGSRTKANRNVMIISLVIVVIAFVAVFLMYR